MSNAMENNLSEGSVLRKMILFALPFLVSNIVQSFYNVADMLIVGNFCGPESMSGVNIGGQVTFILTNIIIGLSMGATVLIGQYVGAKNRESLKKVTSTIITLLLVIGMVMTVVMLMVKEPLLQLIQTPPESYGESESYLTVTVYGIVFIFGYNALSAILRGMGDSKRPFYFVLTACITNIVLDLLFVAGFGWGAFGAALATVISQAMSMFLCVFYMIRNDFIFDFRPESFGIDKGQLSLIFKIGLPTCIQNSITSVSFLFLTSMVNTVGGVSASAAVGAAGKIGSFAFMPAVAISASVSTMSAQNIGANRLDRAVEACRIGCIAAAVITSLLFVVVRIFPEQLLLLFSDDPQMVANGIIYLRYFSYDFLIIPFVFCINGLFIGGGHTMFTLATNIIASVVLRVPICYFLAIVLGHGLAGVAASTPLASCGVLLIVIVYLLSGRWKENVINAEPEAML